MSNAKAKHQFENPSLATDQERVAANIAKMGAAVGVKSETASSPNLAGTDVDPKKDMSDDEFAATEFEAWVREEDEWTPPSNEEWVGLINPHLVTIRIAWYVLHKTKPELIDVVRKLLTEDDGEGKDMVTSTFDHLSSTSDMLKGMLSIVDTALARLIVAGMNIPHAEDQ